MRKSVSRKRYLITGATGFVGANVVRKLVDNGEEVHVLTRNGLNWRLSDLTAGVTVHLGDLASQMLPAILKKISPSVVFHFAAYGAMPQDADRDTMIDVNIKGLARIIAGLPDSVELFVNTGSSSEYGIKDIPMKEDMILEPLNDYGVTKAAATLFCQTLDENAAFPVTTFRLFSPYGPYEQPTRFVPHVIRRMLGNKQLELSSPFFVRDFIYIDDVVDAYLNAVVYKNTLSGEVINIGSGKEHTLEDVVKTVGALLHTTPKISWDASRKQMRQKEPIHWQSDIYKAKKLLGWSPRYSLEQGLEKTIQWMKKHMACYEN